MGTPCQSFSRASDIPNSPLRLRSDASPLGLEVARPADREAIRVGNVLMRFSARTLHLCLARGLPATMEDPARSRLWLCHEMARLRSRQHVTLNYTEFCMWGKRWRKPTAFLAVHVCLQALEQHRCIGTERGCCARTHKPHLPLMGRRSDGAWWTRVAEPYPASLCACVARAFHAAVLSQKAQRFERLANLASAGP